jgi:HK97 family phage portal protein
VQIGLKLFGRFLEFRTKALPLSPISNSGWGWWPLVREPWTGAWQYNAEIQAGTALAYYAVYACQRLISTDVAKCCLRLMQEDEWGVWTEVESPAFSPVLRKPNHYQTTSKFVEQWILSKLNRGNAYVLKQRDSRRVVTSMYVLDPSRVTPLVAPDGSVYYQLKRDDLSGQGADSVTVPASEIIHDTMIAPFHPLIGLSPIYACGLAVTQGLAIAQSSATFFQNNSSPSGILTAPVGITTEQAAAMLATWKSGNPGDIKVLAGELKYQPLSMTAVESDLIKQQKMSAEQVCSTYGVPPYLVDIGEPPPYANFEPLLLKYHSQCIQSLTKNFEDHLDEGLGLNEKIEGKQYGTEFDIDDLIWMDTATRVASAKSAIEGGMKVDEARWKYHGLGPIPGGDEAYMQQQYWPLKQLAERDVPVIPSSPAAGTPPVSDTEDTMSEVEMAAMVGDLLSKELAL